MNPPPNLPTYHLQGMYEVEGILGSPNKFFAHTAHLYVRFAREEMAKIKSCQLQV